MSAGAAAAGAAEATGCGAAASGNGAAATGATEAGGCAVTLGIGAAAEAAVAPASAGAALAPRSHPKPPNTAVDAAATARLATEEGGVAFTRCAGADITEPAAPAGSPLSATCGIPRGDDTGAAAAASFATAISAALRGCATSTGIEAVVAVCR